MIPRDKIRLIDPLHLFPVSAESQEMAQPCAFLDAAHFSAKSFFSLTRLSQQLLTPCDDCQQSRMKSHFVAFFAA
jgi:hypothetical protein